MRAEVWPPVERLVEIDERVEHWMLLDDEQELVAGKRGATRLGPPSTLTCS